MKLEKYKYLFSFTLPLAVFISQVSSGFMTWFGVIFLFGFLPLTELFFDGSSNNLAPEEETKLKSHTYFNLILYVMFFVHLFLIGLFLWDVHTNGAQMSFIEISGKLASIILVNAALGTNLAHEIGHRRGKLNEAMALTLLSTTLYMHFLVEHNKNHHKNVATPLDHASAEKGLNLYAFLLRSYVRSFMTAFRVEKTKTIQYALIEISLLLLIGLTLGKLTVICFAIAGFGGSLLIEAVNYIEHYGLRRKLNPSGRYEKVGPQHSWNSNHPLSRMVLFELSRHSDHHANAERPYQLLRHFDDSPQFPTGYPGMILLATIPSLWFKVMNPMLPKE